MLFSRSGIIHVLQGVNAAHLEVKDKSTSPDLPCFLHNLAVVVPYQQQMLN